MVVLVLMMVAAALLNTLANTFVPASVVVPAVVVSVEVPAIEAIAPLVEEIAPVRLLFCNAPPARLTMSTSLGEGRRDRPCRRR